MAAQTGTGRANERLTFVQHHAGESLYLLVPTSATAAVAR
jgi:hypothetical protein